jgi:hypothetical protein
MASIPYEEAEKIAKEAAADDVLQDYTSAEDFKPHHWVVKAVQAAYNAGYKACYYDPDADV